MTEFVPRKATRSGVRPLVAFYSESGCGKTYSALLLGRGYVGPKGKIAMVDTESGRGSLYADVIPGGFDVVQLEAPFSAARYIEAITALENAGYDIIIVDSASHEWEGMGGVLDQSAENEHKSGRAGLHNWRLPKMEHAKFVLKLLQAKVPIIVCIRAKFKTRQGKDEKGKTIIIKDDYTSPIQSEEFIFEMTVHGEILHNHTFRLTKHGHPELDKCFPDGGMITAEHGKKLRDWCESASRAAVAPSVIGGPRQDIAEIKAGWAQTDDPKRKLWTLTKDIHGGDTEKLQQWLSERGIIGDEEQLKGMDPQRMKELIPQVEEAIKEGK